MHPTAGASKVFGGHAAEHIPMVTTHSFNLHVTAVVIATRRSVIGGALTCIFLIHCLV